MSQEVYLERLQKIADSKFEEITKGTNRKKFNFDFINFYQESTDLDNDRYKDGCEQLVAYLGNYH